MDEQISQVQYREEKNNVRLKELTEREKLLKSLYPNDTQRPQSIKRELFQISFLKTYLKNGISGHIHGAILTKEGVYIDKFHIPKYEEALRKFKELQSENMKYVSEKKVEPSTPEYAVDADVEEAEIRETDEQISQVQVREEKNNVRLKELTDREELLISLYPNDTQRPQSIKRELFQISFLKTYLKNGISGHIHGAILTKEGVYIDKFHIPKYEEALRKFKELQSENMKYVSEKKVEPSTPEYAVGADVKELDDNRSNMSETVTDTSQTKTEEEKHQSLLDNESEMRLDWKNNRSSYDSYLNYKKAIKERLDFEREIEKSEGSKSQDEETKQEYVERKQEYEDVSATKELMEPVQPKAKEEIDSDLDDFEVEERRILSSRDYSEEQKKEMIANLYSKFDEYTEENPEFSVRKL